MRKTSRALAALCVALLAALACSTVTVTTDFDPGQDFAGYRSYAWLPEPPETTGHPRLDSPMVQERVHRGNDRALAAKGFVRASDVPDFYVAYDLADERRPDVHTTDDVY